MVYWFGWDYWFIGLIIGSLIIGSLIIGIMPLWMGLLGLYFISTIPKMPLTILCILGMFITMHFRNV